MKLIKNTRDSCCQAIKSIANAMDFWEGQAQNCKHNFVTETTNGSQKGKL